MDEETASDALVSASKRHKSNDENHEDEMIRMVTVSNKEVEKTVYVAALEAIMHKAVPADNDVNVIDNNNDEDEQNCDSSLTTTLPNSDSSNSYKDNEMLSSTTKTTVEGIFENITYQSDGDTINNDIEMLNASSNQVQEQQPESEQMIEVGTDNISSTVVEENDQPIVDNIDATSNSSFAAVDEMNPNVLVSESNDIVHNLDDSDSDSAIPIVEFRRRTLPSDRSYRQINIELSLPASPQQDDSTASTIYTTSNDSVSSSQLDDSDDVDEAHSFSSLTTSLLDDTDDADRNSAAADDLHEILPDVDTSFDSSLNGNVEREATSNNSNASTTHDDADSRANNIVQELLNKAKPDYAWNQTCELLRREHGLSRDGRRSLRNGLSNAFSAGYYGSRYVIERMKISHHLRKHSGCVNCLNFNQSGDLLCSGSDDTRICVWDWASKKPKYCFRSGHTENIFQTKFLDNNGVTCIISASRDGQVRRSILLNESSTPSTELLYKHSAPVHKIAICPQSRQEIISVGEDAMVLHFDLRSNSGPNKVVRVNANNRERRVRLYSVSHHPYALEFCVCGFDGIVRVYDKRNSTKTLREMCPKEVMENHTMPQVTCAVYNNIGSEIVASYSDDHIYLFNSQTDVPNEFLHCYKGHYNHRTIKGVNFFGPNSEYIISGSDCGHVFYWEKQSEAIMNYMPADRLGVVNCLEPHPWIPVLATSGLDNSIKIWTSNNPNYPPNFSMLERTITRNLKRSVVDEHEFDDHQFHYFMRQFIRSNGSNDNSDSDDEPNQHSSNSNSSSNNGDGSPPIEGIQCRTQ